MTTTTTMTHAELVQMAADWLRTQHGVTRILTEPNARKYGATSAEIPDVFGVHAVYTVIIECKVSHADFKADMAKPSRRGSAPGIGAHRFYCCPEHLIETHEIEVGTKLEGWGLLYATADGLRKVLSPMLFRAHQRALLEELALADFGWLMAERHGGNAERRRTGARGATTLTMPEHVQAQVRAYLAEGTAKAAQIVRAVPAVAQCSPSGMKPATYLSRVVEQGGVAGFGLAVDGGVRMFVLEATKGF